MFSDELTQAATTVLNTCRDKGLRIATAESCTGGLIAALLTSIPGSSDVFDRGFVTYSNEAKMDTLGIAPLAIKTFGAVSKEVAQTMAQAALVYSDANISLSVTGIAGPGGGTEEKPVGLVHFGSTNFTLETPVHHEQVFDGDRNSIRLQAVGKALNLILQVAEME